MGAMMMPEFVKALDINLASNKKRRDSRARDRQRAVNQTRRMNSSRQRRS